MLLRGSKAFITVTETGELNDKGKKVLSVGYRGRRVSTDEAPLASLTISIMRDLLPHINYTTREQFDTDVKLLKQFIDGLQFEDCHS